MGLEAFADQYPHQLSGGMAQRAALARALINDPKVLLLDEPLGALDQFTRMRMQDEVLRIWQARGTTMVLVTHDIDEAIYMSDRIVIMTPRPGRIERMIEVALERPRQRNSPRFLELRAEILEMLHFAGGGRTKSRMPSNGRSAGCTVRPGRGRPSHERSIEDRVSAWLLAVASFDRLRRDRGRISSRRAGHGPRRRRRPAATRLRDLRRDGLGVLLRRRRPRRRRQRPREDEPDRATELVPEEPAAWANLGLLEAPLGDHDAAAQDLEQARKLAPESGAIERLLGLLESRRGAIRRGDRPLAAGGRARSRTT